MTVDEQSLTDYYSQPTGQCPICQRMVVVLGVGAGSNSQGSQAGGPGKSATLSAHDNPLTRRSCSGAGQPPAGEVLTRRQRAHARRFIS